MKKRNVRAPKSIDVIRLRPGQFIGDNSVCDHLIHECIDNFLDELRNNFGDTAGISFSKAGEVFVFDNGRGLPVGEAFDDETKKTVDSVELLFTKLHSGTKFSLEDDKLDTLFGQNGVGLVAVNALSDFVDVKINNENQLWHYLFKDGAVTLKEQLKKPIKYSTEIIFKPSERFFKSTTPTYMNFYDRLKLAQSKLPECNFIFNGTPIEKESMESFVRSKLNISKDVPLFNTKLNTNIIITDQESNKRIKKPVKIDVFLTYESGDTIISGDVNLRFCEGTYLTNIQSLIKNILPSKLDKKYQKAPDRFLLEGLRLYVSLQYPTPQFDSQTKVRFVSDVKNDIINQLEGNLSKLLSDPYIKKVVETILSQKLNDSISKISKKKISADNKLRDCTNNPGDVLYILEGDSAESVFRECRNTKTEANLPLRGKILNVEKQTIAKISENKEIKNIIEAMGQYPYRYNKVKIVADADCLGGETIITYRNFQNKIVVDKIENILKENIKSILSYNFINHVWEEQLVNDIINKPANKEFIEFLLNDNEKIQSFFDHGFPVYDKESKSIIFLNANQINNDKHYFISQRKSNSHFSDNIIKIDKNLIGIKIKDIRNIGKQEKAYCFIVEQNHNFTIGRNNILTFNCDGLHINVLVILIFLKCFPELIKEGRLSVVIPPLYGARKGKEFIPIYEASLVESYKEKGYFIQRFKGLGEMTPTQMRVTLDKEIEHIVIHPKNKKIVDNLIKIITDTSEKVKYLNKLEFNFNDFIKDVFNKND